MLGAVKKLLQHQQSSKSIVDAKLHFHEITRAANSLNGALNYDEGEEITICSYVTTLFISSSQSRFTCLLVSKPCNDICNLCMDEEINIRSQRNLS